MKKSLIAVAIMTLGALNVQTVKAQAVEQGTILIDANYGFPNLFTSVMRDAYTNANVSQDVKISSFGPAALRFEYLVTDKFGVGLEANYANSSVSFKESDGTTTYDYKISIPRFRVMPKFSLHFGGDNDNFDAYGALAAGYSSSTIKATTNDPDFDASQSTISLPTFAFRIAVGTRFFFTDAIGANLEFGLGSGSLVGAGISVRIQ